MKHLFSADGDAALAQAMANRPLLAFDFDGTLAPIVKRPGDAQATLAIARRLKRLALLLPVAVITGRTIDDVRDRLAFTPRFIVGCHGAEDPGGLGTVEPRLFDALRARLRARREMLDSVGVTVEDKRHSVALHYRLAPDPRAAQREVERISAELELTLSAHDGKRVLNIVAAHGPNKADALVSLIQRCKAGRAIFVGDDLNDEPVFAHDAPSWTTIRIGRSPSTRAMFCLDNVGEVAMMLDRLLELATESPH